MAQSDYTAMSQLFLVPFRRNRRFVGREEQLTQLQQQLHDHRTIGITGITGMGGIGKTQLAVEYVYRARERGDYPDGIFWLNGARPLRAEFIQLGRKLQDAMPAGTRHPVQASPRTRLHRMLDEWFDEEDVRYLCFRLDVKYADLPAQGLTHKNRELVLLMERQGRLPQLEVIIRQMRPNQTLLGLKNGDKLSQEEEISLALTYLYNQHKALLIIDNLEDLNGITQPLLLAIALVDLPCHLLFTTRQTSHRGLPSLNLNVLSELDALKLLLNDARCQMVLDELDSTEYEAARSICEILGRLPLALETAAVHLQNHFPIPIARYRDELIQRGALPVLDDPRDGQVATLDERHRAGLEATLQSQWDSLTETAPKEVLQVAGQLPEAAVIPVARLGLLVGLPWEGESFFDVTIERAMQQLLDASLIESLQEGQVRLHPLVREFAQWQITDPDQFRRLCAGRLIDTYEDFAVLEDHCIRRGILAIQEDLLTALDLISLSEAIQSPVFPSSTFTRLQNLLRLLQREMHTLYDWQPQRRPNFLLQQLNKRAAEMGLATLQQAAERVLGSKHIPYWQTKWTFKGESPALERTLSGHKGHITAVAITPDGQRAISASYDKSLKLWNLQTGQVEQTLSGHTHWVLAVAITPDGKKAVSASIDNILKVWNLQTGRAEQTFSGHAHWLFAMSITPDGQKAVSASDNKTLNIWNLQTGQADQTLFADTSQANAVAITPDGQNVISASDDSTLKVWSLQTRRVEQILSGHVAEVTTVAITPDGQHAVSASCDRSLIVWNFQTGQVAQTLSGHEAAVWGVAITPDGQKVVSASDDYTLKIWNLQTGQIEQTLSGHAGPVRAVAITPDGQKAISASDDDTLKVWNISVALNTDIQSKMAKQTLSRYAGMLTTVSITADGQKVVSLFAYHLKVWNLQTGQVEQTLSGRPKEIKFVAATPDGQKAISASIDNTLKVWNIQTGQAERTLSIHEGAVRAVAITPDGQKAISASIDNTLKVWNIQTGQAEQTFSGHAARVLSMVVTPDGQKIVSALMDNSLKVWDLVSGKEEHTFTGHTSQICHVVITPDGHRAISASSDRTLKVWNLQTGQAEQTLYGHAASVTAVAIAPDSQKVFSVSQDNTLKVWHLQSGQEINSITLEGKLSSVAIAPDNTTVVTGNYGGNMYCLQLILG
jgi:WD40 repeat protein